jgi:hypothetical protein
MPSEAGCCSVEFDIDRVTPERECEPFALGLQLDDDPRLVLKSHPALRSLRGATWAQISPFRGTSKAQGGTIGALRTGCTANFVLMRTWGPSELFAAFHGEILHRRSNLSRTEPISDGNVFEVFAEHRADIEDAARGIILRGDFTHDIHWGDPETASILMTGAEIQGAM